MPDPTNQTPDDTQMPPTPGATLPPDDSNALPTAGDPNSDPIPPTPSSVPSPQEGDSTGDAPAPPAPLGS